MSKINWTPDTVQKLGMVITAFLLVIFGSGSFTDSQHLQANLILSEIRTQEVACYHKMIGEEGMIQCGEKGCLYPDGNYCTTKGCFNSEESPVNLSQNNIDFTCRKADGSEKFSDKLHPAAPHQETPKEDTIATEVCDASYEPVCGSNGATYSNECELKKVGVRFMYFGACDHKPSSAQSKENTLHGKEILEEMEIEIRRFENDLKRTLLDIERLKEKGITLENAAEVLSGIKNNLSKARANMTPEYQEVFWQALKGARQSMEKNMRERVYQQEQSLRVSRSFEEVRDNVGEIEREAQRVEGYDKELVSLPSQIRKLLEKAEAMNKTGNFEEAEWTLRELKDLSGEFWEQIEDFHEESFRREVIKRAKTALKNIETGLIMAKENLNSLSAEGKDTRLLEDIFRKANTLKDELKKAIEKEDSQNVEKLLKKLEFEIKEVLQREVRELSGEHFQKLWKDIYTSEDFVRHFEFEDKKNEMTAQQVARQIDQETIAKLIGKGLPSSTMEKLIKNGSEETIKTTLEKISIMEKGAKEIMTGKTALLKKVKDIEEGLNTFREKQNISNEKLRQLIEIKERITDYNFADDIGTEIQNKIDSFIEKTAGDNTREEDIEREITRLSAEVHQSFRKAREEKFKKGIIPFADTDDDQWYTPFAAQAKIRGLVQGTGTSGGNELNPGGNTNLAEAMVMFGRIVGIKNAQPNSALAEGMPEWAKPATGTLEERGVDLDGLFAEKEAGDNITRVEVALLLKQILNLPIGNASVFEDLEDTSTTEKDAIGAVKRAGIMTGEAGGKRFNPHSPLNRAALVKVLIEGLKFQQ